MRELAYLGPRNLAWRDVPEPVLETSLDAIVAPVAAAACDVDSMIIAGYAPLEPPFAIGHEAIAHVVATGTQVSNVSVGDLVVVPWTVCCGQCGRCTAGLSAHCLSAPHMAMYGAPIGGVWGGLFSDLVRVPWADAMLVKFPGGLDPVAMASASDNWPLAYRMVSPHLTARPAARVLILARGSIGLYACDIARALGAADILYVDPSPQSRQIAESYGARTAEATEPIRHGFDLAVEATGRVDQLAVAVQSLAPDGFCESAGNHFRPGDLPLLDMYLTGVTLRIARDNPRAYLPEALALAASGRVDPARVVSGVFGWDQLPHELPCRHRKPVFTRRQA